MFTGIIETTGIIKDIKSSGSNKIFWIASSLHTELKIDQSLSHSGVCLTIEEIKDDMHRVTAIEETLTKTNLNKWQPGNIINLERCMLLNGRLDGHIVQGHVDCIAECINIKANAGSWEYTFVFPVEFNSLIIEKGSITIDGISLTPFKVNNNNFSVAIIPYTYEHTNMKILQKGDFTNIEFDVIGKYVERIIKLKN